MLLHILIKMKGMIKLMNKFFRKTTAILLAGIMSAASLGTAASAYDAKTSESVSFSYLAGVSKPTYAVKGVKGKRYIKLSCSTSKATIYYTTDGSTPSKTNGKKYGGGLIKITKNTKIRAIAYKGTTKSAVMTKTFYVTTKTGDVTGDGKINSSDYTRLKKYLNGETSYICKDNADTSGNGSVSSKDLTLLKQYLNEDISSFPASGGSSSVTAPSITVYKTYGGKQFKLTAPKGTIYYTTNGSTPTKNSNKYTDKRINVTKDTTVKYVTYYKGKYSSVRTKTIEVDSCSEVTTKTDTSREYDESVTVNLACGTSDAIIYYTTDGSDPRSSYTSRTYTSSGIKLTQDSVVKAYASCKGYSDSSVSSFSYKVRSQNFTVSGYVWADTTVDGKKSSNESGISDITVTLVDSSNSAVSSATTNSSGYYTLGGAKKGKSYKVMFTYNGQKYRAYDYIVTGGNQAVESAAAPALTISNSGAVSGSKTVSSANSYAKAIADKAYTTTATTSASYTTETQNVNLALKSENYGSMKLSFTLPSNNTTATPGSNVDYSLTLSTQNAKAINSATVRIYIDNNTTLSGVYKSNGTAVTTYSAGVTGNYACYDVVFNDVAPNSYITYTVKTIVKNNITDQISIKHCAQVMDYSYAGSCYDKNITPGAMTVGIASQNSEAVTPVVTVGQAAAKETLIMTDDDKIVVLDETVRNKYITAIVNNPSKFDGSLINLSSNDSSVMVAVDSVKNNSGSAEIKIRIAYVDDISTLTDDKTVTVTITLASDTSKKASVTVTIKKPEPVTPPPADPGNNNNENGGGTTV